MKLGTSKKLKPDLTQDSEGDERWSSVETGQSQEVA